MSSNAPLDTGCSCVRNEALVSKCPKVGRSSGIKVCIGRDWRGCRCGSSNMISNSCKLMVREPGREEGKSVERRSCTLAAVKKIGVSRNATEGGGLVCCLYGIQW